MADSGYITGTVDHELLLRNEYLAAENRILRGQLKGRLKFSDAERAKLGEIGRRLGRKALGEVATERACLALCNGRAQSSCIIRESRTHHRSRTQRRTRSGTSLCGRLPVRRSASVETNASINAALRELNLKSLDQS
jgi:hypothetical protein